MKCWSSTHFKWLFAVAIPCLVFLGVIGSIILLKIYLKGIDVTLT